MRKTKGLFHACHTSSSNHRWGLWGNCPGVWPGNVYPGEPPTVHMLFGLLLSLALLVQAILAASTSGLRDVLCHREQQGRTGRLPISDGSEYPWRAKLRGPSFVNLQVLPKLLHGYKMSDVIAILGSLDFVVGEVDR